MVAEHSTFKKKHFLTTFTKYSTFKKKPNFILHFLKIPLFQKVQFQKTEPTPIIFTFAMYTMDKLYPLSCAMTQKTLTSTIKTLYN